MTISYHQVLITPLKNDNEYGIEVDVTDFLAAGGIGNVVQSIDAGNYDIGLYTYADLTLTLINYDGRFNNNTHAESMFYHTRDRAKVTVKFYDNAGAASIVFKGIINDEATTQNFTNETVQIRVLSRDSILRKTIVVGGLITDGMLFSNAIKALLNRSSITSVITYDASLISVALDYTVDVASVFSDKDTREVLDQLLSASGSVFRINSNDKMVVSPRTITDKDALALYGGGDPLQQDNILSIKSFNDGLQRTFNTFTVNGRTASDADYIIRYGSNIKEFTFDSITSTVTATAIATYLLGQFKAPKNELEVVVPVDVAKNAEILDPVTISFPKKFIGYKGTRVPIAGVAIAGADYTPYASGGIVINNNKVWKITAITQDTKNFQTILRLREDSIAST